MAVGKNKVKVMAFGTFDILHPGHLYYLNEAKSKGDELIVVVSTDKNAQKLKGKKPINREDSRLEKIKTLHIVDSAILGSDQDMFAQIRKIRPNFIALGYDQKAEWLEKKLDEEKIATQIFRAKPFEEGKYKSSLIIEKLSRLKS